MLLEYTYLLAKFDASIFNDANMQGEDFIFPIDEEITDNFLEAFQTLVKSKSHFCFYISFQLAEHSDKFFKEENFRNIIRLLFLSNYLRIDDKVIFFIENGNVEKEAFNKLKNKFYIELRKQGINEFIVETLNLGQSLRNETSEKVISVYDNNLNSYLNEAKEEYFRTLINSSAFTQNFHKKWIVPVANRDDFMCKRNFFEKFERWMWRTHSFSAKLIVMDRMARQDNTRLKSENAILRYKLESNAEALKLIRYESANYISEVSRLRNELNTISQHVSHISEDHYKEVILQFQTQIDEERNRVDEECNRADATLAWYKKEYEVLPAWYKRFGHIIKVIKGKRSFKSLFK